MKGRKLGQIDVTIDEIQTIATMTADNFTRRQIAEAINRSQDTVWRYQKKHNLF